MKDFFAKVGDILSRVEFTFQAGAARFSGFPYCFICSHSVSFSVSELEIIYFADPKQRMTLDSVAIHSWVIGEDGPIPQYLCWCKRNSLQTKFETHMTLTESDETRTD